METNGEVKRGRFGLALGGGGTRGIFHIGVVRALAEEGLVPDVVAGTSAGAIVGSLYRAGLPPDQMVEMCRKTSVVRDIVSIPRSFSNLCWQTLGTIARKFAARSDAGLLVAEKLEKLVNSNAAGNTFSSIAPLIVTATDIETGELVLFCSPEMAPQLRARPPIDAKPDGCWTMPGGETVLEFEDLGVAVRASSAVPALLPSVVLHTGGRERRLNDGGLREQVPVKPLIRAGCDRILAVYIGFVPYFPLAHDAIRVFSNFLQITASAQIASSLELAQCVIYDPAIETFSLFRFQPELADRGYAAAKRAIPHIRAMLAAGGR
ncbi:MAG: patatin-like phospholipase family protein [Candidatus Riflebacteria bacterium]|nr:patatin-like phospholipase family protein [Candidatus Riflebacteria bacterium]